MSLQSHFEAGKYREIHANPGFERSVDPSLPDGNPTAASSVAATKRLILGGIWLGAGTQLLQNVLKPIT